MIPEEAVHSGAANKGEQIFCADCLPATTAKESIVCDRCRNVFNADSLRQGEAVFVPHTAAMPSQILCKRCAIVNRTRRGESRDARLLWSLAGLLIVVSLLGGLLGRGFLGNMRTQETENKELRLLAEETRTLRDMVAAMQRQDEVWRKEWLAWRSALTNKEPVASEERKASVETDVAPQMLHDLASALLQKRVAIGQQQMQGDLAARVEALLRLCKVREEMSAPLLIEVLRDGDPLIRSLAARLLGSLGVHAATGRLLVVLKDQDPLVRKAVAQALSLLTGEQFIFFADVPPEKWQKLQKFKERSKDSK